MPSLDPFLPYGRQTISEDDIAAVVDVLRSPHLTQGPAVPAFEQAVTSSVGAEYGVAVNSATSALHLACIALGVDQVIGSGHHRLRSSPQLTALVIAALKSTLSILILPPG